MKRFGRLIIQWDHEPRLTNNEIARIEIDYADLQKAGKRLVLGTLTSRSGTKWLCDIFAAHPNATGSPERSFDAASFYRYIRYNDLPIDTAGVMAILKYGIIQDWKKGDIALVFSPHFSHGLTELYEVLKPERIIFALNDPEFTVQSIYNKGFFSQRYVRSRTDRALGFQPALGTRWGVSFGRLVPNGPEYDSWNRLTRVGKIAWWGNMVTLEIGRQLSKLPSEVTDIFHLKHADQNYAWYKELANRYGLAPLLDEKSFLAIKKKRFKKSDNVKHEWSSLERAEFEDHAAEWMALYQKLCISGE